MSAFRPIVSLLRGLSLAFVFHFFYFYFFHRLIRRHLEALKGMAKKVLAIMKYFSQIFLSFYANKTDQVNQLNEILGFPKTCVLFFAFLLRFFFVLLSTEF